jgi:hypothetical protein
MKREISTQKIRNFRNVTFLIFKNFATRREVFFLSVDEFQISKSTPGDDARFGPIFGRDNDKLVSNNANATWDSHCKLEIVHKHPNSKFGCLSRI